MQNVRPDRVLRVLTTLASLAYFGLWAGAAVVLIALPALKVAGGSAAAFHYGLELPVVVPNIEATVDTAGGPARLTLGDVRAKLRLPVPNLPWSLVAVLWTYTAVAAALMLLLMHNLRRIFQRVRDGAAFDAQNASRLRTLSVLLVALATLNAVAETATAIAVRRGLPTSSSVAVPSGLHVDLTLISVALVLMALAEVFRRGTELEDEQSFVV